MNKDLPVDVQSFLVYIDVIKGKSPLTVNEYASDLRTFFKYMLVNRQLVSKDTPFNEIIISDIDTSFISSISLMDAYSFLKYCKDERSNNAASRSRKVSSIRMFFNYMCAKTGKIKDNPMIELDAPKIKKSLPKYLTAEQSLLLLSNIEGAYKERDYCIITLFLNCGLRLSELVGLDMASIEENKLRVVGKGNKERIVYMNDACLSALKNYLNVRPVDKVVDRNALFISRLKKRISAKTVQKIVYDNLEKAGLGGFGFSTHKLRHTAATLMYQHGNVDVLVLKEILGHENLGTTEIYTHLTNEQLEKAANSNPLANVKSINR